MGTWLKRLDNLYPPMEEKLTWQEIDELVHDYQQLKEGTEKAAVRNQLLHNYHQYFMKYTALLMGNLGDMDSSDTKIFLSLFLAKSDKRYKDYISIYRYITYICRSLRPEDIYNEMVTMFLVLLDKFTFRPNVSFACYITKYMRWTIKTWIMKMANDPLNKDSTTYQIYSKNPDEDEELVDIDAQLPTMDLAWVHNPSSSLFLVLSQYERSLLYLSYKENLSIREISKRLGRGTGCINMHLQRAISKLREEYKKGEL